MNPQPEIDAAEIRRVFGAAGNWRAESLIHNPKNAVTAGVWRVTLGSDTAILKILTRSGKGGSWRMVCQR